MQPKTINALKWIVNILDSNQIPYRIGGGFAAHMYGSGRIVNDIDISLSGKYFPIIVKEIEKYITAGPKHYSNEKWDCDTLSLEYEGQQIDMTDIDTLRMSNLEKTDWFQVKDYFRKFPAVPMQIEGIKVELIDPRDLVAYKNHLMDRDYQIEDVNAVKKYISEQNLMNQSFIIKPNKFDLNEYTTRSVVRCAILNEDDTKVLFFGSTLVGGGVEGEETDEEAIARECMEEAGATVKILKYLGEVVAYRDAIKKKYVVRGYVCKQVGGLQKPTSTSPDEQGIEAKWIAVPEAITQLEREISELEKQETFEDEDLYHGRIYNRKILLYFLKDFLDNK